MKQPTHVRAPMLPLLLGLITGFVLARYFDTSLQWLLILALIGSLITLLLASFAVLNRLWVPGFLISATLCFWAYGQFRFQPKPGTLNLELPEREVRLCIEVQTVLHVADNYGKASAFAQVLKAPENSRLNPGDRLYIQLPITLKPDSEGHTLSTAHQGLRLETTGVLTPIKPRVSDSPKEDFNTYLKNIGIYYKLGRTWNIEIIRPPTPFSIFCATANKHFQEILRLGTPMNQPELANIYVTTLLGKKSELTDAQNKRYRMTGTMHFFAISGLHIGIIATVIAQCLLLIRVPPFLSPLLGLPLLYLYVEITGGSPSAVRAFLMAAFFWSSFAFNRQHTPFSALISSAIFVLVIHPNQLWSIGFQLSYTVVGSILLFGLPLYQILRKRFEPYRWLPEDSWKIRHQISAWLLDKFLQLFAISFAAWLASAPLCAGFFDFISPGTIVLNMLLVYLVAVVIIGGILSLACSIIQLSTLSGFINHSAWLAIYVMDRIVVLGTYFPNFTLSDKPLPLILSYGMLNFYFITLFWFHFNDKKMTAGYLWLPILVIFSGLSIGVYFLR